MSCEHITFPDGTSAIICGVRRKKEFCACGRVADFLCDWKVSSRKSGTCDRGICKSHAQQVAPEKHLCQEHQETWANWQAKHGTTAPITQEQQGLFPEGAA
jgi:hypothetical protein